MPLFFAHPAAAWLLPAAALPVVFHLFFRLRRQVREFPSLLFFQRIDPRLSAKRKIHEWLVLLLRCLFIALLVLALMRPTLGTRSLGDHVARLVLIDNSGSMAGTAPGGGSKLALATRAAQTLLDSAHPGDSIAIQLMLPDATSTLEGKFGVAAAIQRDALGRLTPTDGAAPVAKSVRLALAALADAKAPQHELDILTDLQTKNWSRGELDPEANGCRIIVHRIESVPLTAGSVSLTGPDLSPKPIPAGRLAPVRLVLRNVGPTPGHVQLNSTDDSGQSTSRAFDVPASAALPVTLTFSFPHPGFHWAQVWLEGDAAPSASRVELGFTCTEVRKAVFAGDKSSFGALPYAVSPGGNADLSGIDPVFTSPHDLASALADKPLAVALTWEDLAENGTPGLQDYVRNGGTLFLLPAPGSGVTMARPPPSWLSVQTGTLVKARAPEPAVLLQPGDSLWTDLVDASGQPHLGNLRVFQYLPLTTGADWQTLIAAANGSPLWARRSGPHGQIFASGLALTPPWSSLPLRGRICRADPECALRRGCRPGCGSIPSGRGRFLVRRARRERLGQISRRRRPRLARARS